VIPLSAPDVTDLEVAYVTDATRSGWLSGGLYVHRFEDAWAARCDAEHAVAVSSGTAALQVAIQALGCQRGDEVVVPAFTFAAVAAAVIAAGGVPTFADVDPRTWCIDASAVAAAITPRTVGVIAVHSYGHPAPMPALTAMARRHGLWVLEDAAEAHGARLGDTPVGVLGDAAAFSFYGNKIVTAGEGGAVTTNDSQLADTVRTLANQGVPRAAENRYEPREVAGNHRLSNVAAALLCAQVERMDDLLAARRAVEDAYRTDLADAEVQWQERADGAEPVPWLVTVLVEPDRRDAAIDAMAKDGVQARRTFPVIPDLAPYRRDVDVVVSRQLAASGISLPTYAGLSLDDVGHAAKALRGALTRRLRT
jgi:perosamine synthetase